MYEADVFSQGRYSLVSVKERELLMVGFRCWLMCALCLRRCALLCDDLSLGSSMEIGLDVHSLRARKD